MDGKDPAPLIDSARVLSEENSDSALVVLEWLMESTRRGKLYPRGEVLDMIEASEGISREQAAAGLRETVGDIVDPVQQVSAKEGKHVGVIEYHGYDSYGAYGYLDYDDVLGERKRVVCGRCVEIATRDHEVAHATEGEGSIPAEAGWQRLLDAIQQHYAEAHDLLPEQVTPGATLLSGTTISGNQAYHSGNDGPGSGLDADTLRGFDPQEILSLEGDATFEETRNFELLVQWQNFIQGEETEFSSLIESQDSALAVAGSNVAMDLVYFFS